MHYADYAFYTETFKGTMPEADFCRLAERAQAYLDGCTFGRAKAYDDAENLLKHAGCALADIYLKFENGGGIASEKVGNISVNYVAGISNSETQGQALDDAARMYLSGTGLLYRGI